MKLSGIDLNSWEHKQMNRQPGVSQHEKGSRAQTELDERHWLIGKPDGRRGYPQVEWNLPATT